MAVWLLLAVLELARIIAGETPDCPFEAKLAVAHVYQRNQVWFGDGEPTRLDIEAALTWQQYPDPTDGAVFLIGPGDAVKLAGLLGERTGRWECGGTWVESYRARGNPTETKHKDGYERKEASDGSTVGGVDAGDLGQCVPGAGAVFRAQSTDGGSTRPDRLHRRC